MCTVLYDWRRSCVQNESITFNGMFKSDYHTAVINGIIIIKGFWFYLSDEAKACMVWYRTC